MSAKVEVYKTPYCGFCVRAVSLLRSKGVPFDEIDVSQDDATRHWLVETTGQRTVPQIFINGKPVGGFTELNALDRSGRLDGLLAEPEAL
ncbi:MAG: glutaredoxin 3 [Myxococcales bacterium]|nr:glutaredoxin 3 [Myxococcales bacterium]